MHAKSHYKLLNFTLGTYTVFCGGSEDSSVDTFGYNTVRHNRLSDTRQRFFHLVHFVAAKTRIL